MENLAFGAASLALAIWVGSIACGVVLIVALSLAGMVGTWPSTLRWLTAAAVLMTALAIASLWLVPRINAARDQGTSGHRKFRRLHGVSVALTLFVLLLGASSLITLSVRGL